MTLLSPDEWAEDGSVAGGTPAWWRQLPDEVVAKVLDSKQSRRVIVRWFHEVVAAEYPDESWPREATKAKLDRLLADARS